MGFYQNVQKTSQKKYQKHPFKLTHMNESSPFHNNYHGSNRKKCFRMKTDVIHFSVLQTHVDFQTCFFKVLLMSSPQGSLVLLLMGDILLQRKVIQKPECSKMKYHFTIYPAQPARLCGLIFISQNGASTSIASSLQIA